MTRSLIGCIQDEDYAEIQEGVQAVKRTVDWLSQYQVRIDVPHPHRYWEYGTAVQAFLSVYTESLDKKEVLDIGSGWSPLGPTLSYCYNVNVTECEPDVNACAMRLGVNHVLHQARKKPLQVHNWGFGNLPGKKYDAVFCVSVVEHLPVEVEDKCWQEMSDRLKPGGLLFVTADCVEVAGRAYQFDNLRVQNFLPEAFRSRIKKLQEMGLTPMGRPDFRYHGAKVCDYTFFRMGFVKMPQAVTT